MNSRGAQHFDGLRRVRDGIFALVLALQTSPLRRRHMRAVVWVCIREDKKNVLAFAAVRLRRTDKPPAGPEGKSVPVPSCGVIIKKPVQTFLVITLELLQHCKTAQ